MDIREGDLVQVEKGGEIIPKVVGVNLSQRPPNSQPTEYISQCPECSTELIRVEGEAKHYCPNETGCPTQIKGKMTHFISRKAMDIDGLGEETIEQLFEGGLIQNYADLYTLQEQDVLKLDRMAQKSVSNLLQGIENSKQIPFERVLFALGIRYVGETVSKKLAKHFKNMNAILNASLEEMTAVDEIGEKIAESLYFFLQKEEHRELINRLKSYGLQFEIVETESTQVSTIFEGKTFVVSGVFENYSRNELKKTIEDYGGKNVGSISKKTDYLVAGYKMGPAKKEKAESLGVTILSEQEFGDMLD